VTGFAQDEPEVQTVRLVPGRWTPLPGTGVVVHWDGDQEITVARAGGFWNLAPLTVPGRVLAWARLAGRPELGMWPVIAIGSGAIYRSRSRPERYPGPGGRQ
jgi:hypothetical protein